MRTLVTISDQAGDGENGALIIYSDNYSRGAAMIVAERYRVMDIKGRTIEHDQRYEFEELPDAAMAYLIGGSVDSDNGTLGIPDCWPFNPSHYKGAQDRIADLVRVGQFVAAEIDRLIEQDKKARNPSQAAAEGLAPASIKKPQQNRLAGFRSEGTRLEANPDTLSPTAKVFEPGTGSDPSTWFDVAPHVHDGDTAHDGVCKDCDPTQLPCHEVSAVPPRTPCTLPQGHKEPHDWPVYSETAEKSEPDAPVQPGD